MAPPLYLHKPPMALWKLYWVTETNGKRGRKREGVVTGRMLLRDAVSTLATSGCALRLLIEMLHVPSHPFQISREIGVTFRVSTSIRIFCNLLVALRSECNLSLSTLSILWYLWYYQLLRFLWIIDFSKINLNRGNKAKCVQKCWRYDFKMLL